MQRRRWFALLVLLVTVGVALALWDRNTSLASHPEEYPEAQHFVTITLLEPRHGQIFPNDRIRVRMIIHRPGIADRNDIRLYARLDGQNLSRGDHPTGEPHLVVRRGERDIILETRASQRGVHTLEVGALGDMPYTNSIRVKFGTR